MTNTWIEVWIDSSSAEYILVLRQLGNAELEVCDPQEDWRTIEKFATYEDAVHWLNEDEYDLVEGRLVIRGPS
jgi:hypothetical protein